jgi:DNA-binding NarL/FixJ family response regulator
MNGRSVNGAVTSTAPLPFSNQSWDRIVESFALPPQQRRIIEALLRGMRPKEIAADLGISLATVRTHLSRIFKRFGVKDRFELLLSLCTEAQRENSRGRCHPL